MATIAVTGTIDTGRRRPAPARPEAGAACAPPPVAESLRPSADRSRINWLALCLILAGHAALLAALILLDVIPIQRRPPPVRTVIELVPLPITPPPAASPAASEAPPVEVAQPQTLVAPPPIVQIAAPAALPVPAAPPPVPAVVASPAAPVPAPAAPAAAITAPSSGVGEFGNAPPRYPPLSLRRREQGTVRLRVVIDAGGLVRDIAVAASSGFERLDKAALDGIRRWRFHPGTAPDGQPVDGAIGFLNYSFALRG